jgi:oxalate decarboxylase/phosphoglucose isomerase-like protein (cupin superfamily)
LFIAKLNRNPSHGSTRTKGSSNKSETVEVALDGRIAPGYGEATFYDKEGAATVLTKGKGILLPKGWYYRFHNTGGRPLIILRFGADKDKAAVDRTGIEGQPIPSRSRENNFVEPQPIEGSFWSL